ncbi:MAG: S-layer homology domain-containing protein [Firmicutes bacterium]|nr:S-layer homology domain-containing protein [Bacillota bacterium]
MNKTGKKIASLFLSAAIAAASFVCVWADAKFSDVPEGYWAAEHIRNASDAGIIYGYTDGSFKPKNDVNRQEALAMIYRVLRGASLLKTEDDLSGNYTDVLDRYAFSNNGLRTSAAYFFENSVLEEADLQASEGAKSAAPRELIAVWASKAMGYEISPLSVLKYNDTASIEAPYIPYVDALYRYGIMIGGTDGNFSPKNGVVRAEMAAIAVRLLKAAPDTVLVPDTKASAVVTVSGNISLVNTSRRTMAVVTPDGTKTLHIKNGSPILLDGESADISALSSYVGSDVVFSCVIGCADSVAVQTGPTVLSGTVSEVRNLSDCSAVTITLKNGANAAYIYEAGSTEGSLPSAGDSVDFISDGALLLEIR